MLRDWQKRAEACALELFQSGQRKFLLEAWPGAGKTIFSIALAKRFQLNRSVDRFIFISPSTIIKRQWIVEAARFDLKICNVPVSLDTWQGVSLTYQQLPNVIEWAKSQCCLHRVFLVCDEIHHAAETEEWGLALQAGFAQAGYVLNLSGTPFRSDNIKIGLINYVASAEGLLSQPDFVYGYEQAIYDRVCRQVAFMGIDGDFLWQSHGREYRHSFKDEVEEKYFSARLNTALMPDGDFVQSIIKIAGERLRALRKDYTRAGCLFIAKDQEHAKSVAYLIEKIFKLRPAIAISDDENSDEVIKDFRSGNQPFLVSVRMVSEGVDIKRLAVLAYLTTITTATYFRQALGRVIRNDDEIPIDKAWFYFPADPRLLAHAEIIEKQIVHCIKISSSDTFVVREGGELFERGAGYESLEANYSGVQWSRNEVVPEIDIVEQLRSEINRCVLRLSAIYETQPEEIHRSWLERGGKRAHENDAADLREKLEWLKSQMELQTQLQGGYVTIRKIRMMQAK